MLTQTKLAQIKASLTQGEIIAIPTDTVYGLACDAFNIDAVQKISKIKGRESAKFYVLQIADISQIQNLVEPLTIEQKNILTQYWPGEITFIFNKNKALNLPYLDKTIGIRIPNHTITKEVLSSYKNPLVVTSLNKSGEPPAINASDISEQIKAQVGIVIENNKKPSATASTVVDLTTSSPSVLRQGNIQFSVN